MPIEHLTTIDPAILREHAAILATKDLIAMVPGASRCGKITVLNNYCLMTAPGRLSPQEYREIFARCVEGNDFTELILLSLTHEEQALQARMAVTPEPPSELVNACAILRGHRRGTEECKQRRGTNPIGNLLSLPVEEQPDWLIAIDQSQMTVEQVYEVLEAQVLRVGSTSNTEAVRHRVNETARGVLGGKADASV